MADEEVQDRQVEETAEMPGVDKETEGQPATPEEESTFESRLRKKLKEVMTTEVENVGALLRKLTVTVSQEFIAEQLNEQFAEFRREAAVPGFRKGRAPQRLVEKRFGSEAKETLLRLIVGYGYETGIEKTDLKVLGEPRLWVKEKNDKGEDVMVAKGIQEGVPLLALPESGPLSMSYEVEVRPEFELPPIDNIPVTKRIITVTDKDIDQRMEQMRNMFARLESVPDGTVQTDDILMVDIRMVSEGTELKKQENVQLAARPQMIEGVKLEKLGEALAGAKMEEVKTITGQLPDTYPKADFRGKPADFEIRIRQISRFIPASIEEAVKRGGFEKEEDMRDWIRSEQESQVAEYVQQDMSQQIIQYLLDKTNLDVPERLSEQQAAHVVTRRLVDLMQRGVPQAEVEKRADEMITSAKADVAREMKLAFIMAKLTDTCKVEVSDEEINAQIAMIARRQNKRFDRVRDDLNKRGAMDSLYIQLRDAKIIDELLRKATVTEEAAPAVVTGDDKGR